jgi:hypothetical protein
LLLFLQKRAYSDGNPNATISPPLLGVDPGLPVVTNNIPCPNDGPAVPRGDPTLNSQSFLPVSASNAITIPYQYLHILQSDCLKLARQRQLKIIIIKMEVLTLFQFGFPNFSLLF